MNTAIEDVQAQILRMVEKGTFTAEAAEGIAKLRLDLQQAIEHNNGLVIDLQSARENNKKLVADNQMLAEKVTVWQAREALIAKREQTVTELEKQKAVAEAKTDVFRECFGLVFRNFEIHKALTGTAAFPSSMVGGYPQTVPTGGSESTVMK